MILRNKYHRRLNNAYATIRSLSERIEACQKENACLQAELDDWRGFNLNYGKKSARLGRSGTKRTVL